MKLPLIEFGKQFLMIAIGNLDWTEKNRRHLWSTNELAEKLCGAVGSNPRSELIRS